MTEKWNKTPLPNGVIRLTKRNRINPLTGKPYPTWITDEEIERYHESRKVVAEARRALAAIPPGEHRWIDVTPADDDLHFICIVAGCGAEKRVPR